MGSSLFRYCVPCLFGLEGLVADELRRMDLPEVRAEDGRVFFSGTLADCVRANISLRCGERVLLQLGSFPAPTFDALFEGVRALPWGSLLPKDASFPVTGYCLNSALFSVPDCQRIVKKAVVESMKTRWKLEQFPETGAEYKIRFSIRKDQADLFLDTSGTPLHKRGYRPAHTEAALRETLAAAMVKLARYRGKGDFCDPFCGSGTIAIEAALAALNRAPGLYRSFAAENWAFVDPALWRQARAEALVAEYTGDYHISGAPHRLPGGGRGRLLPKNGTRRHRHQPPVRRTAAGCAAGGGALPPLRRCAFKAGQRGLVPVPALVGCGL